MPRTPRQRTADFFLQLLVVVLGVTISLGLDAWRGRRQADRRADELVQRLRADLAVDLDEIETAIERTDGMVAAYRRLLDPDAAALPDDSLDRYVDLAVSYTLFLPNDEAYEGMRQTGTSALLDPDHRADVIRLYTRSYGRAAEWDEINRRFVLERMIPYLETHAPETGAETVGTVWIGLADAFRGVDDDPVFRNLLRTNVLFKSAQRTVYDSTRVAAQRLERRLAASE